MLANRLTLLQHRFINEWFLTGGNATQAAKRAGYKGSYSTVAVTGHDNLKKPKIKAAIDKRLQDESMGVDELLFRISQTARMDISPYLDKYGRLIGIDLKRMVSDGHGHLVKGIKQTKDGTEIILKDPQKAMDQLLKFYGADKHETVVNIDQRQLNAVTYITENRNAGND